MRNGKLKREESHATPSQRSPEAERVAWNLRLGVEMIVRAHTKERPEDYTPDEQKDFHVHSSLEIAH